VKARVLIGVVLGAMVVAVLVSAGLLVWRLEATFPRTTVTEQDSGFDASRFPVLLFPTGENAVCERAVMVRLDEYEQDAVDVYKDGGVVAVAKDRFTAAPPAEYPTLVERLNAERVVWGEETDWRRIEWDFESGAQGITATLRGEDKRGTVRQYTYLIGDDSVQPVSERTVVDVAKNMAN
jgi:hypothetical protein